MADLFTIQQRAGLVIDLRRLAADLRPLVGQWRVLGVQLNIPPEELDCIEKRVNTPSNCFAKVLEVFLADNPHQQPEEKRNCKDKIIEALKFPAMSKGNLAKDIEDGEIELVFTVRNLTQTLHICTAQWQQFALALSINSHITDRLKCEPRDLSQNFSDMLRYWLENRDKKLDDLVEAVKFLGKTNLANKIETDYKDKLLVVEISHEQGQ